MSSNIEYFRNVLNDQFVTTDSYLSEPGENMRIDIDKTGCNSLIFQFDLQLKREYKGGMFPFFNSGEKKVCKVCDYIIFSEKDGRLYSLIIELKKGKEGTNPQLKAGECFSDFTLATVNRVYDKDFSIITRKISIKEFKRKSKTRIKDIEYNMHNIHEFTERKLRVQAFLK